DGFGGSLTLIEKPNAFGYDDPNLANKATTATAAQKQQIEDILYRQIGLSRTRVFPQGFEVQNDNADPQQFNLSAYRWNLVDPLATWQRAGAQGSLRNLWASFPVNGNSPSEGWLRVAGDSCVLNPAMLDEYVEWLLAPVVRLKQLGFELGFMTVSNEP